jgi:hypothetical protein
MDRPSMSRRICRLARTGAAGGRCPDLPRRRGSWALRGGRICIGRWRFPSMMKTFARLRSMPPTRSPRWWAGLIPTHSACSAAGGPIVPRPRKGHRRRFGDGDKQWILQEAAQPGASAAEVAHRYGIAPRVLRQWKQELAATVFVAVQISGHLFVFRGRTRANLIKIVFWDGTLRRSRDPVPPKFG